MRKTWEVVRAFVGHPARLLLVGWLAVYIILRSFTCRVRSRSGQRQSGKSPRAAQTPHRWQPEVQSSRRLRGFGQRHRWDPRICCQHLLRRAHGRLGVRVRPSARKSTLGACSSATASPSTALLLPCHRTSLGARALAISRLRLSSRWRRRLRSSSGVTQLSGRRPGWSCRIRARRVCNDPHQPVRRARVLGFVLPCAASSSTMLSKQRSLQAAKSGRGWQTSASSPRQRSGAGCGSHPGTVACRSETHSSVRRSLGTACLSI